MVPDQKTKKQLIEENAALKQKINIIFLIFYQLVIRLG